MPRKLSPDERRVQAQLQRMRQLPEGLRIAAELLGRITGTVDKAIDTYERVHWGIEAKRIQSSTAADPQAEVLTVLGDLVEVRYATKKGGDRGLTRYDHEFSGKLPQLCFAEEQGGRLVIAGGSYTVSSRGIVG